MTTPTRPERGFDGAHADAESGAAILTERTRLREALEAADWALQVGKAWTEEYLANCREEDIQAEVERVQDGLKTIDECLAKIKATLGSNG